MTLAGRIAWDDTILPFQLDRADVRGRVGRLDSVLETIVGQHAYPAPVAALVAEAALITALIGQTIKPRWKLSLQVRSDGPVRLLATDYFGPSEEGAPAKMRAYAGFDPEQVAGTVARPFGLGEVGFGAVGQAFAGDGGEPLVRHHAFALIEHDGKIPLADLREGVGVEV